MKPAGLIFAAGESSRMGRDKALLGYQDSTFLNHLISLFVPRTDPVIVVLGHNAASIRKSISAEPVEGGSVQIVVNDQYKLGMLSSFQAGIRALPAGKPGALFTLVDHPAVKPSTLDRLLEAFQKGGAPLVIPRYRGKRGHPVAASRALLDEMLRLPLDSSPKEVVRAHRAETCFIDVDDAGVALDIDVPEAYEALNPRSKA